MCVYVSCSAVREMSDKDRSSPTLVESSLKSLLDQPSIFPLIGKLFLKKKKSLNQHITIDMINLILCLYFCQ